MDVANTSRPLLLVDGLFKSRTSAQASLLALISRWEVNV